MIVELPRTVGERLHDLAAKQGREIEALVEEAVSDYLQAAAITDLSPEEVAEAQEALLSELRDIPEWKGGRA
jgi:hypothetical protein